MDASKRLDEVRQRPKCHDWGKKVQDVCTDVWRSLDQAEPIDRQGEPIDHPAEPIDHHAEPIDHHSEPIDHHPEPIDHHPEPIDHHPEPIDHQAKPIDQATVDRLAAFLNTDQDAFGIARLVIAELRLHSDADIQPLRKRRFFNATDAMRARFGRDGPQAQLQLNNPLYRAERELFQDSQLHRARLLLQHSGKITRELEDQIHQWLDKGPKI